VYSTKYYALYANLNYVRQGRTHGRTKLRYQHVIWKIRPISYKRISYT